MKKVVSYKIDENLNVRFQTTAIILKVNMSDVVEESVRKFVNENENKVIEYLETIKKDSTPE